MTDLVELQQAAAAADAERARLAAELAQAEAEAEARALAAQEQREAEVNARTATFLEGYDEQAAALVEEERHLRQVFLDELLAAPWAKAWIAARAARWRRSNLSTDGANAAARLGSDRRIHELPYRDPMLLEDVVDVLEQAAVDVAADEQQQRWEALGW